MYVLSPDPRLIPDEAPLPETSNLLYPLDSEWNYAVLSNVTDKGKQPLLERTCFETLANTFTCILGKTSTQHFMLQYLSRIS